MDNGVKGFLILVAFIFVVALVIVGPLVTIWSLNTLFAIGIPYTIWTWLAVCWCNLTILGGFKGVNKS